MAEQEQQAQDNQEVQSTQAAAPQPQAPILLTRRNRRWMLRQQGALRYVQALPLKDKIQIMRSNIENGRKLHQQHLDRIEQQQAIALEAKLESVKETWTKIGYNAEEIALLEEAWSLNVIKDKETYRADRKKARQLQKEAQALMQARKK